MSNADKQLDECGCCEGVKRLTPASIENLPGLTALAYRVGTHGSFKSTMQAALSGQAPLRELTTRDDDDPAIALLDGWATVLDVLSFYQERIAGEGYLRTATERRSILEMARSIGYELRPGVAAGTFLAFTLETAPGAPRSARIPLGSKAQSTPAQDETPQVFETTEEILAVGAWNELRPKQTELVPPSLGLKTIYLKGASTNLKPGDGLLIIGDERLKDPGNENWDFRRVTSVTPVARLDAESSYTIVDLNEGLGSVAKHVNPAKVNPRVYALRQRCSLFGYNAPDWRAMPNSLKAGYLGLDPNNPTALFEALKQFTEWPDFNIAAISDPPPRAANGTGLYGEYYDAVDFKQRKLTRTDPTVNFDWGGGSPDPLIGSDTFSIRWTGWVQAKISDSYTFRVISDDGVRLWVDGKLIINEWHTQGATGHSSTSTVRMEAGDKHDIKLEYFEQGGAASVKLFWSAPGAPEQIIPISQLYPRDIHDVHLDAIYAQIPAGSWVVLGIPEYEEVYRVKEVAEDSRSNFTLSAKTTHLVLQGEQLRELFNERVRDTVVFGQSEELQWAERPITAPVAGIETELSKKAEGLVAGRLVAISGADASTGEHVAEIATIDRIAPADGSTKLLFTTNLEHSYRRDSMVINANVARATHGDTKEEVLGSGDGSRAFQKFVLKQNPLTFVSAATAGGAQTTLAIRVEDVLWKEAPSLYRLASTERAYTTRIADDGKVTVQFGDGVTGARPPTGAENISAKYRVGIGLGGMLEAGQINLLMSRPLGVNGVANPLAPTGAEDPEERDQARQNAPITVLTLDRIVSLRDFEDFSRAFAGIGKAQATWLWAGEKRLIHLTVAGVDGGNVPPASELYRNLVTAIDGARHVDQRVKIESYKPVLFDVEAKLLIDPDYLFDDVRAAVEKALVDAFAFSSRSFGQAVTASEVIAIAQGVKGVVALDLDNLYFDGAAATLQPRLPANIAHWVVNEIKPAELLTVNRAGIKLTEMSQ